MASFDELEAKGVLQTKFDLHDMMGDGTIPSAEVTNAVQLIFDDDLSQDESVKSIISKFIDSSGSVEFEEFRKIIQEICKFKEKETEAKELREAFYTIAKANKKNKKGQEAFVDFKAVKLILQSAVGEDDTLTDEELDAMVKEADTDKSGTIEVEEFVEYMLKFY